MTGRRGTGKREYFINGKGREETGNFTVGNICLSRTNGTPRREVSGREGTVKFPRENVVHGTVIPGGN